MATEKFADKFSVKVSFVASDKLDWDDVTKVFFSSNNSFKNPVSGQIVTTPV